MKKNSCTPINPKKYSCYGLKKIHTRNLITKKNSCGSKIPPPPHNISNGPSLRLVYNQSQSKTIKTNQTCILYSISMILISNLVRRSVFLTTIPPATVQGAGITVSGLSLLVTGFVWPLLPWLEGVEDLSLDELKYKNQLNNNVIIYSLPRKLTSS